MIVIGFRHALLCLHRHNPDSTSIRGCVMPDPTRRPTIYSHGVLSDADSLETSCERCVLPLADLPHAAIYRWKGKESRTRINAGDPSVWYKGPPSPSHEM
jgi:hypothetical protein